MIGERKGQLNTKNVLSGIVPTFAGWAVEPGTNEDMVYESYDVALTTPGSCPGAATITYDIGIARRIIVFTDHEFTDMITWTSVDGVTWRQCTVAGISAFGGVYRYLQIRTGAHAAITWIKTIVYYI